MVSLIIESSYRTNLTKIYILPLTCKPKRFTFRSNNFWKAKIQQLHWLSYISATKCFFIFLFFLQRQCPCNFGYSLEHNLNLQSSLVESSSSKNRQWRGLWIIQSNQVTIEKTCCCQICTHATGMALLAILVGRSDSLLHWSRPKYFQLSAGFGSNLCTDPWSSEDESLLSHPISRINVLYISGIMLKLYISLCFNFCDVTTLCLRSG